jgi:hypothetical protein
MKNDHEVLGMRRERSHGKTQEQAAARGGMSVRTARKYERLGQLPSQLRQPRTHRTCPNPFAGDHRPPRRRPARGAAATAAITGR